MPVVQYPHTATVLITTDGGADANGYPLPPVITTVALQCRAEPNTQNTIIYTGDGTAFQFKYVVYIKKGQQPIPIGSVITVIEMPDVNEVLYAENYQPLIDNDGGSVMATYLLALGNGIVKMYHPGQLNARLWV